MPRTHVFTHLVTCAGNTTLLLRVRTSPLATPGVRVILQILLLS